MAMTRERAIEAAKRVRGMFPYLVDVAVFSPSAPYIVAYREADTGNPWIPFCHVDGFAVYLHRTGSIPPR